MKITLCPWNRDKAAVVQQPHLNGHQSFKCSDWRSNLDDPGCAKIYMTITVASAVANPAPEIPEDLLQQYRAMVARINASDELLAVLEKCHAWFEHAGSPSGLMEEVEAAIMKTLVDED